MSKKKLFDEESDNEDVTFKTQNEYAKKYDNWREKEELHKLEQKYGSKALSEDAESSSDSEDDDDEPLEVSEETEAQFLKTLALLKTKDPRIYDPNFKCFDEDDEKEIEEIPTVAPKTLTFEDSDDSDSGDGNIFKIEKKAEINTEKQKKSTEDTKGTGKEAKIKDYLIGKAEHIDEEVEKDLAPLKALWSDPKLSEGEAFLRDYILNKRYLEDGDVGEVNDRIRDDEDLEEDERKVEEQDKFERAYNFRFEEPDDEFLKRYPRTLNYTRPKDDRRSKKRAEVRARKEEEKRRKMEEIARLKALKMKEIQEKIAKIKEVTGNEDLAFREEDIEGDFDPEEHDRRMKALFDEEFYGEADDQKPVFPDLDEELEIENWDKYDPEQEGYMEKAHHSQEDDDDDAPHCEDEDFNMDADYDPKQAKAKLIEEIQSTLGKKRRNRKKKSKLHEILATEKPKFVPTVADKTYQEYMEEYYKMDCEDVIGGDLPTRFKYREVVPNDYGLSIEEILLADDKELTQWVPLKKIVKHRPREVEKSEVFSYKQKAADERLKRKILPSLFKDLPQEPEIVVPIEAAAKKKKKKKNKTKNAEEEETTDIALDDKTNTIDNNEQIGDISDNIEGKSKKKKKIKQSNEVKEEVHIEDSSKVEHNKNKSLDEEILETDPIHNEEANTKKAKESESESTSIVKDEGSTQVHNKKQKVKTIAETSGMHNVEENKKKKNKIKINTDNETHSESNNILADSNTDHIEINGQIVETNKKKRKKKKNKADGFVVVNVQNLEPSHSGHIKSAQVNKQKVNLKRKTDQSETVPNKKRKIPDFSNDKNFKNKFKQNKNKFKNKHGKDTSSDNPLNKLSDERLKAYGLNPKKYRSFLKYKKF